MHVELYVCVLILSLPFPSTKQSSTITYLPSARMRSEGLVLGLSFRPSVCLSVTTFSPSTRNKTAKKQYQLVHCHTGFISKMAILVKRLRSKVMAANMQISTGSPRPRLLALCILKAQEVTTKGMYRLPHAIYYALHSVSQSHDCEQAAIA